MFVAWCSHCEVRIDDIDEWVTHTTPEHREAGARPLFTRTRSEPRWLKSVPAWNARSASPHAASA